MPDEDRRDQQEPVAGEADYSNSGEVADLDAAGLQVMLQSLAPVRLPTPRPELLNGIRERHRTACV
ncbi:hypothetical protein SHIRM173S_09377 [Streptomyces hirsutus]